MIRKSSIFFLAATLFLVNVQFTFSQTDAVGGDKRVRSQVEKLGTGAKVTVKMKDGSKLRGSISQILDDSFDVTLAKAPQSSIISYRDVESVKRRGWTNSAKVALGVGIGVGAVVVVIGILVSSSGGVGPSISIAP